MLDPLLLVHGWLALALSAFLLLFPRLFAYLATGHWWAAGDEARLAAVFARLTAAGAILVFLVASATRQSARTSLRSASVITLLAICLITAGIGALIPFSAMRAATIAGQLVFAFAYAWVLLFRPQEI